MADFTLTELRVIREVIERGSFTAAAKEMGYTQSAVSRQVALAERVAGRPLFERRVHGVEPTPAGRLMARHADAVLAELEAARQGLDELSQGEPARLRIGAFSSALAALVPRALSRYANRHPHTRLDLKEGTSSAQLARVAGGRLDVAVIREPDAWPDGVSGTFLLEDPLLLAVPRRHPLAERASIAPDELAAERWIAGSAEPDSEFLGPWTASTWAPDVAHVARSWMAKLGLVAAGRGVTIVPGLAAPTLPAAITVVRIDDAAASRSIALATVAEHAGGHRSDALQEALRDAAAELGSELRDRVRRSA
jgi:DNA-binding transcriptional LysR family regulator